MRLSWNQPLGLFTPVLGFSSSLELEEDDDESCRLRLDIPAMRTVDTAAAASSASGASLMSLDIIKQDRVSFAIEVGQSLVRYRN